MKRSPLSPGSETQDELRRYVRAVTRAIAAGDPHLAEDLEQQTHLSALGKSPRDPAKVKAWLRRIALNHLHTELGRRGRTGSQVFLEERDGADESHDPADIVMTAQVRDRLREHLDRLSPRYRSVIELRVLEGQPPRDVSKALDIPVNTVRTRTRRGLEALRAGIEAEGARQGDRDGWWRGAMALPLGTKLRWLGGAAALAAGALFVANLAGRKAQAPADQDPVGRAAAAPGEAPRDLAPMDVAGTRAPAPGAAEPSATFTPWPATEGAPPVELELVARLADGSPAVGAEAFALTGTLFGAPESMGRTGPDGRLEARLPARNAMVALRGAVGQLSQAVSIDRPLGVARPRLEFVLEDHEVDWTLVRPGPNSPPLRAPVIVQRPADGRDLGRIGSGAPVEGAPLWVPAWESADGRFGIPRVEQRAALALFEGREVRAMADLRPAGAPAPAEWTLSDPIQLRGRLVDRDSGAPLPGRTVDYIGAGLAMATPMTAVTDEAGRFTFDGVPVARGRLDACCMDTYHPVDAGEDTDHDVGDVPCRGDDRTTIVLGEGLEEVGAVRVYTKKDRRRWISIQTTTPARRGLTVTGFEGGRAIAPARAEDMAALAVDVAGPSPWAWIVPAPPEGFGGREVVLPGPLPAPAEIIARAGAVDVPLLLRFIHRASGAMVRFDLSPEAITDRTVALSPGTWLLLRTDAHGTTSVHRGLELVAGERVELGSLVDRREQVPLDWSEALGAGAPGDELQLEVTMFIEPVLARTVKRRDLARELATIQLAPDRYRLHLAGPDGERHDAAFTVRAGGETPTVRPLPHQVALTLVRPDAPYGGGPPTGKIDVYGEDGGLLRSYDTAEFASAARFDLCVPASASYRVDATLDGVALRATIQRDGGETSIRRMLSRR